MMRQHKIFVIQYSYLTKDRLEDEIGELTGYSQPYRRDGCKRVIASSQAVAFAWCKDRIEGFELGAVTETPIDAFLQEHIY